jgi:hypothetical protein
MARRHSWQRIGRLNGSDAGRMARKVYICRGCGFWHQDAKPKQCHICGRMDYDYFDSTGEAKRYATLELLQRAGEISDLRRQVPLKLLTIGRNGLAVQWGTFIVDAAYVENGEQVYEDFKPFNGMSPDSALKLRCLEAQGIRVRLHTEKGTI